MWTFTGECPQWSKIPDRTIGKERARITGEGIEFTCRNGHVFKSLYKDIQKDKILPCPSCRERIRIKFPKEFSLSFDENQPKRNHHHSVALPIGNGKKQCVIRIPTNEITQHRGETLTGVYGDHFRCRQKISLPIPIRSVAFQPNDMFREGVRVDCPFCQSKNTIACGELKSASVRFVCTTCGEKSQVTGIADYYFVPFSDLALDVGMQTYSYEDGCGRYTIAVDELRAEYTEIACEREGVRRKIRVYDIPTETTDVGFDFQQMMRVYNNTWWMVFTDPQGDDMIQIQIPFCKLYTGMIFAGMIFRGRRAGRDQEQGRDQQQQRYRLVNFPDVLDVPFNDLQWRAGEYAFHYTTLGAEYIIPIMSLVDEVIWSAENGGCRQQIRVVDVPF